MGNQEQGNSGEKAESSVPSGHGSLGSNSGVVERRLELLDEQLAELRQHIESPLFKGLYIDDAGAGALPLLDRAKSAVNVAYALESLLYSAMRLRASEDQPLAGHAVTSELLRVRGYYQKIDAAEKKAEGKEDQPAVRLNREAAARVIKHGIGNSSNQ